MVNDNNRKREEMIKGIDWNKHCQMSGEKMKHEQALCGNIWSQLKRGTIVDVNGLEKQFTEHTAN